MHINRAIAVAADTYMLPYYDTCYLVDDLQTDIARHDGAMRKTTKEVMKGRFWGHFVIADVGLTRGFHKLGVHSKRTPEFVLPNSSIQSRV